MFALFDICTCPSFLYGEKQMYSVIKFFFLLTVTISLVAAVAYMSVVTKKM